MTETWTKYSYVCTGCDSLFEVTSKGYKLYEPKCCGFIPRVSVEDATIYPTTNERQQMINEPLSLIETYNPNALTTYKHIENGEVTYKSIKTVDLEGELDSKQRYFRMLNDAQSKINQIIDNLTEEYWFNSSTDKSEVLSDICEILGHEAKKTINFSGTITISGSIDIPFDEVEDFDLHYFLGDEISVDINHGDTIIDWELDHVREDY